MYIFLICVVRIHEVDIINKGKHSHALKSTNASLMRVRAKKDDEPLFHAQFLLRKCKYW